MVAARARPADARPTDEKTTAQRDRQVRQVPLRKSEEADRAVIDTVGEVAAARGLPRAQIALAWLLAKPGVTAPIVGATKPRHLDDAVAALEVKLSPEEIAALEAPYAPHSVVGFQ